MKKKITKSYPPILGLLLFVWYNAFAQLALVSDQTIDFSSAVSTVSDGNWSNPAIWSNGQVPIASTDVIIEDGHTVYIDVQGSVSAEIVDLCRNLQIKQTAVLQMGHDTPSFAKDLRINGSILCNGTFSSGRNLPGGSGDGSIYTYNSRIYLNLIEDQTYISGSGFFNPRSLSIASNFENKNLIIDLYNMMMDDNFAIKSNNRVNVTITHYAYIRIKGILGLTGSDYQFSSPTAKSDLTIHGIVVTNDISLFTKNTTPTESTSLTIANQGSLYTQKINKGNLDIKTEAAGFTLNIDSGGLFRLGQGVNFANLTSSNPYFVFNNNGELREHYSQTLSNKDQITAALDQYDPNKGASVPQIKHIFGASHISGWYNFTDRPYLLEGLDIYKDFGATSVKTTLTAQNGNMYSAYHFNHTWPNFANLKEVAQHEYVDSLFKRSHIKKHTFWTTTKNQSFYKNGPDFNHNSFLDQEQQFYDLTKYLLETYGAMDKRFTYQNWEGDWMLRGQGVLWENDPNLIPDDVDWKIEGMARLFRARQRGTERARNEVTGTTAKVFHAIEFNKLWMTSSGSKITMMENNTPSVLGNVIPSTRIDLSSWSAYDGGWYNTNNPLGHAMWKGLEIARYFTTETGDLPDNFPVQIGEFGINENPLYYQDISNPTGITNRYARYIGVALGLGIPNFYLWNLYGNDKAGPSGFTWEKDTQYETSFLYDYLVGKWIIEPDGSWGVAASFLMEQWQEALSIEDGFAPNQNIRLYPNPATDVLNITGPSQTYAIAIYDLNGRKVMATNYLEHSIIDVSNLSKGSYILKIQSNDNAIEFKKLIKN
ncbi:T9SS type A sorting domain-containing protein [Aestuariivivens sediminis]|uniref:T9SS type A sorting domain-containing protein n=1 Tax=Aestuariivivens sediminis TaxID=2913557 RepID=UPI001F5777D1|nr:T9SS type A sorting domain-containing protein [Aestuariivivens sediminis]